MSCKAPIPFEALIAYWMGELPEAEAAPLEEHFFACAHCTRRLEGLASLAEGVRSAVRSGRLSAVVSAGFVESMKARGMRLREYRVAPGGRVDCTIHADDDAVVSRIEAPLAGVKRLDALEVVHVGGAPVRETRIEDVPFDAAAGAVHFIPPAAALKRMPANTFTVRLVAVDERGDTLLGEYTFAHSPQPAA